MRVSKRLKPILIALFGLDSDGAIKLPTPFIFFLEQAAGVGHLTSGVRAFGYTSVAMDAIYGEECDLLTPIGFSNTVRHICLMVEYSVTWWGVPCWSWVFLSMGTTGRRPGQPMGDKSNQRVQIQNILVSRICFLLLLCHRRKIYWAIEQPRSSILFEHPRLRKTIELCGAKEYEWKMGALGAVSQKDQKAVGTFPKLHLLEACVPSSLDKMAFDQQKLNGLEVSKTFMNKEGKRRCVGGKDLHFSQIYPINMGAFFGRVYHEFRQEIEIRKPCFDEIISETSDEEYDDDHMFRDFQERRTIFHWL